jgi:hypothetical protein
LYEAAAPDYLIPRLDHEQLSPAVTIIDAHYGLTEATIHYRAASDATAVFHWFYFPGWRAALNGHSQPLSATHPDGLIQVDLPAGEHILQIGFGPTPLRQGATALSWLSLLLLLVGLWWWRAPPGTAAPAPGMGNGHYALLLLALFGLGLSGIKTFYLDGSDTIFRRSRFDGQQVSGVTHPLQINFDRQLILLGYDLATPHLPADGLVDLTLYWRAAQPLTQEFSVAVHLLDEQGRRYGQHDTFHPAGLPTTRWQMAAYARDRHRLSPWPGTPPGEYRLLVRLYERESGRIRPYLNEIGQPVATEYELATVTINPARRQPDFEPPQPLNVLLHDGLWLLGTDTLPASLQTGEQLVTTFFWQAEVPPMADYQAAWQLVDEAGGAVARQSWLPGRAAYPPSQWSDGQLVRDEQRFLIPAGLLDDPATPLPDGRYGLELGLLDEAGRPVGERVHLGELAITSPPRRFDLSAAAVPLTMTGQLGPEAAPLAQLRGYHLEPAEAAITPGAAINLTLYWQSLKPTATAYTVFVHLLGEDETILAQSDHVPAAGSRPTTGWLPGEIVADTAILFLPADASPGPYRFRVGLYDPATGHRLRLLNSDTDAIILP